MSFMHEIRMNVISIVAVREIWSLLAWWKLHQVEENEWTGKKPMSLDTAIPQTGNTVVPIAALISVEATSATGRRAPSNSGGQNNSQ